MSKLKLCLEDLSNEVLMEIFDYLNCRQMFFAFFNMNYRFNLLCTHYPYVHLDASDPSFGQRTFNKLLNSILSRHVRSLKFCAEKWILRVSVKYFSSLNSLTFIDVVNPRKIKEFLEKLPSPNQLHHLSISFRSDESDGQDLTTTISKLPNLNRLELYSNGIKSNVFQMNQSLLSLRHFSIRCFEWNYFLQLVPFMPNLISLELPPELHCHSAHFIFVQPNSLSKLKSLHMNNVHEYDQLHYIFRLCPQVEIFKVQCQSRYDMYGMIKGKVWEELLIPMKFLRKIQINVRTLRVRDVIDLSEYDTEFWTQRNLKAVEYNEQKPIQRCFCIK